VELVVVGESLKKADRSAWSPSTTHGLASPTGNAAAAAVPRTWRSPSPVYSAYRTGWLPAGKPASPSTATSPLSLYQHQPLPDGRNGQVDTSPSANCSSTLHVTFTKPEQPSSPSSLRLVCDGSEDVTSQPVCSVQHRVVAVDGVVNGYCHESEADVDPRSGDESVEQRNRSPSSTSVDPPAPAVPSSSRVSETLPVEAVPTISNGSDSELVSSVERGSSVVGAAAEKNEHVASQCGKVANAGEDSERLDHDVALPEVGLTGLDNEVVKESTNTNQARQTSQLSNDKIVTSSPLHRESDLLLSARRTSIDYFQKVYLVCRLCLIKPE